MQPAGDESPAKKQKVDTITSALTQIQDWARNSQWENQIGSVLDLLDTQLDSGEVEKAMNVQMATLVEKEFAVPTLKTELSRNSTLTLTLRLHVRRQPSLGRSQCGTKTSASGAKLYKIITQLHPQRRILGKVIPLAPLLKSRVCHKLASPIMAWVPPSSCTNRIPK